MIQACRRISSLVISAVLAVACLAMPACAHTEANTRRNPPAARNVYFDFNKWKKPRGAEDYATIGAAVEAMKTDEALRAVVIGHTDDKGSKAANQKIGFARAETVKNEMTQLADVPLEARIRVAHFADEKPVADNSTEEGRAMNRRVEILFYYPDPDRTDEEQLQGKFGGKLSFKASASVETE